MLSVGAPGDAGGVASPDTVADAYYFSFFHAPYQYSKLAEINQNVKA